MKMYSVLLGLVGLCLVSVVRSQEPTAAMDMEGRKNSMFFFIYIVLAFFEMHALFMHDFNQLLVYFLYQNQIRMTKNILDLK